MLADTIPFDEIICLFFGTQTRPAATATPPPATAIGAKAAPAQAAKPPLIPATGIGEMYLPFCPNFRSNSNTLFSALTVDTLYTITLNALALYNACFISKRRIKGLVPSDSTVKKRARACYMYPKGVPMFPF